MTLEFSAVAEQKLILCKRSVQTWGLPIIPNYNGDYVDGGEPE